MNRVQATKMADQMTAMRLRELGLFSLETGRMKWHPFALFHYRTGNEEAADISFSDENREKPRATAHIAVRNSYWTQEKKIIFTRLAR